MRLGPRHVKLHILSFNHYSQLQRYAFFPLYGNAICCCLVANAIFIDKSISTLNAGESNLVCSIPKGLLIAKKMSMVFAKLCRFYSLRES